jgi:hypothetical protein
MALQPFYTSISLNLANASFTIAGDADPFAALLAGPVPVQCLVELTWDRNPLTPALLRHLETLTHLQRLSLELCRIPADADDVGVALLRFVGTTQAKCLALSGSIHALGPQFVESLRDALIGHATITQLNVADNGIGIAGLRALRDLLLGRSRITQVWCDGSRPDDPNEFIQILNALAQSPSLTFFAKPRHDIERLVHAHPSLQPSLKAAWHRLAAHLRENTGKGQDEGLDRTNEDCMGSQPMFDLAGMPVTTVDTSWDISIELGYGGDIVEWEELRNKYSVEKLTGGQRAPDNNSGAPPELGTILFE